MLGDQPIYTQWCRVAIICRLLCFYWKLKIIIQLCFVVTLEAPQDMEQDTACGSQREQHGPPRAGNSIGSLGRLILWGV